MFEKCSGQDVVNSVATEHESATKKTSYPCPQYKREVSLFSFWISPSGASIL